MVSWMIIPPESYSTSQVSHWVAQSLRWRCQCWSQPPGQNPNRNGRVSLQYQNLKSNKNYVCGCMFMSHWENALYWKVWEIWPNTYRQVKCFYGIGILVCINSSNQISETIRITSSETQLWSQGVAQPIHTGFFSMVKEEGRSGWRYPGGGV